MIKHTKGPWEMDAGLNIHGPDNRLVANCGGRSQNFDTEKCEAENKANAHLIAAAPELLEALEMMVRQFGPHPREDTEGWREEYEACDSARAAIAKAKGES